MGDPELNCLLAVCCEPAQQEATLAKELVKAGACDKEYAPKAAAWLLAQFDLAPKGTLRPFVEVITRLARG
jgi:hypothetical protein